MEIAEKMEVELGRTYRDGVTGFEGIATSFMESLHEPTALFLEDDKTTRWLPLSRLELVEA